LVSNTGVVANDTTGVGTGRNGVAAAGYGSTGQAIFGYTFAYLMFIILKHKLVLQNLPTVIFFPIMIAVDILWNMNNNCYSLVQLLVSLTIGGLIGYLWGYVINKTKMTQLQYFNQISGKQACTRPSKSTFKCNVYKNGQLISGKKI
jgi:hypothetical protein